MLNWRRETGHVLITAQTSGASWLSSCCSTLRENQETDFSPVAVWPRLLSAAEELLTEFDVTCFIRIHLVGVAASDVSPHRHRGVCEYEIS